MPQVKNRFKVNIMQLQFLIRSIKQLLAQQMCMIIFK